MGGGTTERLRRFEKKTLTVKPVLYPPNQNKDYRIMADASERRLSGILLQDGDHEDDPPRVVSYASRKLRPNELLYSTIEKEILSVVFSLAKFRPFVYGKIIRVQSDHRPLCFLNSIVKPHLDSLGGRWPFKTTTYSGNTSRVQTSWPTYLP